MKVLARCLSFVVFGACSVAIASKPCHALNGGHTVTITSDGAPIEFEYQGSGRQQIGLYTAKLSIGTHQVPAMQECGQPINWQWSILLTKHIDENNQRFLDLDNPVGLNARQNTAQVSLPVASRVHYGYFWNTTFAATASQGITDCHPQGWDQSDDEKQEFYDTPPTPTSPPAPPPPLPPGGGIIASFPTASDDSPPLF